MDTGWYKWKVCNRRKRILPVGENIIGTPKVINNINLHNVYIDPNIVIALPTVALKAHKGDS